MMQAHFIDVGQGDAILLEFPCAAMLVDTGGEKNDAFDSNKALKRYLTKFFARRTDLKNEIKLLAITHPHIDHTLGIKGVLLAKGSPFKIANVITNGQDDESLTGGVDMSTLHRWAATQPTVKLRKIKVRDIPQGYGRTGPIIDPIKCRRVDPKIRVLWSAIDKKPKDWEPKHMRNANNHSMVIRVDFGKSSFLLMGDLEEEGIPELIGHTYPAHRLLDVDVLKAGHHGSYNGTTASLMEKTTPKIAVIQMGPYDRVQPWTAAEYGHPRMRAVRLLQQGVSHLRRPPKTVRVSEYSRALRRRVFKEIAMKRAVYATGWDGTVIIQAFTNGYLRKR